MKIYIEGVRISEEDNGGWNNRINDKNKKNFNKVSI
jgi:hypothetical protein